MSGNFEHKDVKSADFIAVQQGNTRYLLRVLQKAQNLISAQYYRARAGKYYGVWFDGRAEKEEWTNKRNLQNHYKPMITDVIRAEEILVKFSKLAKGNTMPEDVISGWNEMTGKKDVVLCN